MSNSRVIWEGWTVQNFIDELELLMRWNQDGIWCKKVETKKELKDFCKDNQTNYKKHIPEVVDYFSRKYNIK